jgi:L-arabinose isomerase
MAHVFDTTKMEVWFVTGSQHLYGREALDKVAEHSQQIASGISDAPQVPVKVIFKPVMTDAESITRLCLDASSAMNCIGLIFWMHTFSPGRMWIPGLKMLSKPFLHLHTQFNRELPWSTIDMDFMNLNQSAHGDREFGFTVSRMRINRKVVVGFWQDDDVLTEIGTWIRAAAAWHDARELKIARFGDNMRNVAVTEGDKVEAGLGLGYTVNGYGVGDLVKQIGQVSDAEVDKLVAVYGEEYIVAEPLRSGGKQHKALLDAARIELGLRHFLQDGDFQAFTDTFEDLHGLGQLPGIAVQRLMADGYGFGAEGDWKTAALVRSMKVMANGLPGGTSFMEDYTYHLKDAGLVLGAHMLEVCPSIADGKPSVEIQPLSIGGKGDPVRLVFTSRSGPAVVASLVDMGTRFRLVVNRINVIPPEQPLPKLPVARAVWKPEPNLKVAATAWILAGGAHHTSFSLALTSEHLTDFAEMANLEFLLIDGNTSVSGFKKELYWNALYYHLANGL